MDSSYIRVGLLLMIVDGVGVEVEGYSFFALNVPLHGCDLLDT